MWSFPVLFLRKIITLLILTTTLILQFTFLEYMTWPNLAEAAVVTIDDTVNATAGSINFAGSQTVFISDLVGYRFYRDGGGNCAYRKTSDAGANWAAPVSVDAQTDCVGIAVWYDQWTEGDFGSYIHIATMDENPDDLWYNRLDTTTDTLWLGSAPISTVSNSGQGGTFTNGANLVTLTKSTTGELLMSTSDVSDSFVVRCNTNCNLTTNWNEAGTPFMDTADDWNILMPLSGGDVLLINRDISADDLRSRVWNGSTWSSSWTTIDLNAIENGTYDPGMAATVDHGTGDVYLAYAADNNSFTVADHDIRTAKYSSGSWTSGTSTFNNTTRGLHSLAISVDTNTSTVYVGYVLRTTIGTATTGNVYWATSTTALSAWSPERGPVNGVAGDFRGVDLNAMSDERIYITWTAPNAVNDLFGDTIVDIAPATKLTASGTATSSITASTSNVYVGGQFVLRENQTSRNVTDIVLTERGTIAANSAIANVKLFYELDTTAPYDCGGMSYNGTETQYGATDTNGFSGVNGTASFSDLVSISTTQTMCLYTVLDVLDTALDGDTLAVSVETPNDDIIVTGGGIVMPQAPVRTSSSTLIRNDELTQTHFHWRTDTTNETGASSATAGVANTNLSALLPGNQRRLRIQISNEGSLSSPSSIFRLEYAEAAPSCDSASSWTDVGATDDAWNMFDSTFITDGSNTTNIAIANGGVADENTIFLTPNGAVKDISSNTGALTLTSTNFLELEYSITASTSAVEGTTYCFRVSNQGTALPVYSVYPSITIAADVSVTAIGTQVASLLVPSTVGHVGGAFSLRENTSSRNITSISVLENGTVDASTGLDNIQLRFDLDTTNPYDCTGETYSGSESQFGSTDTDGFSGSNGTSTFSGSQAITTTSTMCVYVITDVTATAQNGQTIQIEISSPANDVGVSAGSVSPSIPVFINGTTTLAGAVMAQTNFHWRNDNGTEATSTSATAGTQNTVLIEHSANTPIRLRLGVSNEGLATSVSTTYRLEFGPKITTCSAVSVWTPVGDSNDDWNMYDSTFLTHGANTTNIAGATGGITDANTTFFVANAGVRDTTSTTSSLTLTTTEFTEFEFSLTSTNITGVDTSYCFRLTAGGVALPQYDTYAELRTAPRRDFKIQRGTNTVTGTGVTLTAGVNYVAPASTSTAFVRITNTHYTGSGRDTAGGGAQNADDVTAYLSNTTNITSSFTIGRPAAATANTRVSWEIIEFIGELGTDNEMLVRGTGIINYASASTSATGTALTNISDDGDIVVFITGLQNQDIARNLYYTGQSTANWDASSNQPIFQRGASGALGDLSYAVVEFTGINWNVERVEHTYTSVASAETESITPVNSLARTFLHAQKRMTNQGNVNNYGHEVWLSSIGAVSFQLEPAATNPSGHTSVAWVIENMQTSAGAMTVNRERLIIPSSATEPFTLTQSIIDPIDATNNASIFATSRVVGANTTFPLVFAGARIVSTTTYEVWRSEATADMTFRSEIVEWPVSGLAVRQNYYRFYVDNNSVTPTDPWPIGASDLGENSPITVLDEPLGESERIRIRMTMKVANANLPAGLYDFRLQYGLRITSCSSVGTWTNIGNGGSGEIWRGYAATGTTNGANLGSNPPLGGEALINSVSDRLGSLIEEGVSPANPYLVDVGEDVEYDWIVEHNGATERSTYCFRIARGDGTPLDGYFNYPQIRTAGFSPQTKNWRFYDDEGNETQTIPLSGESVAPTEVTNTNVVALRITVGERKNVEGQNVKFSLQYDEDPNFTNPTTLVSTTTCNATSTWCYADGAGLNNATITTKVLSDADSCTLGVGNGCGFHNSSATFATGMTHNNGANAEYVFYLKHAAARAGAVYYFRLYEVFEDVPVPVASGESYPSLIAETPKLTFTVTGLSAGTTTAGIVTTSTTTPTTIAFGAMPLNTDLYAAHRISVYTNATEGYRVYTFARQQLLNSYGVSIPPITGTNALPVGWAIGCLGSSTGCVGYHSTDATLMGGSTRFSPVDSYAALHTNPAEVMYSPIPATESHDMLYRVVVRPLQPSGDYETEIVYVALPVF